MNAPALPPSRLLLAGTIVTLAVLVWSGIRPFDRATWIMEVAPVVIVLPVLYRLFGREASIER